ncbi:MAG: asparagine synthase-related protein [Gemmatimonadota bacterium]
MAAIVGFLAALPEAIVPDRWDESRDLLRERSAAPEREYVAPGVRVAFRGAAEQQFAETTSVSVYLDGRVENIAAIAEQSRVAIDAMPVAQALSLLFAHEGEALFARLEGAFSLTLIDHAAQRIYLVRDKFGSRPLFVAQTRDGWAWASECRSLLPLVALRKLDLAGFGESMHYRWIVGDRTLFEGIEQVLTASYTVLTASDARPRPRRYWRPEFHPAAPAASLSDWADRADEALHAYCRRMIGPRARTAVLLSGGTDSSLIGHYVSQYAKDAVLVTPTWRDFDDPELPRARAFARLIGLEHRVIELDQAMVSTLFPYVLSRLEQPSRNFHALTLAALLPELSGFDAVVYGEAADTMFGPFGSLYVQRFERKWSRLRRVSGAVNSVTALLPQTERVRNLRRLVDVEPSELIRKMGELSLPDFLVDRLRDLGVDDEPNAVVKDFFLRDEIAISERYQAFALATDVVCHMECVDRLFAPRGIDVLTPFLSTELFELGLELPSEHKSDERGAKPVLKTLAGRFFPEDLVYAPKLGFPTPTERWVQNELAARVTAMQSGSNPMDALLGESIIGALDSTQHLEAVWTLASMNELVAHFELDIPAAPVSTRG